MPPSAKKVICPGWAPLESLPAPVIALLESRAAGLYGKANWPPSMRWQAITLIASLLFLAPLAGQIPLGALAAILFVVAYNMRDLHHFLLIARSASRPESFVSSGCGHKSFMQGT